MIYLVAGGYTPSKKAVAEMVREMRLSEIDNPRFFYSWLGVAGEFIRAEKERDKLDREEEKRSALQIAAPPDAEG